MIQVYFENIGGIFRLCGAGHFGATFAEKRPGADLLQLERQNRQKKRKTSVVSPRNLETFLPDVSLRGSANKKTCAGILMTPTGRQKIFKQNFYSISASISASPMRCASLGGKTSYFFSGAGGGDKRRI